MQVYVHNIIIICGLIMVLNLYAHHAMVTTVSTRQIMEQQQKLTEKGFKDQIYPLDDIFRQEVMAARS